MVLPLQTWQYSEPKRLWLLLGGLSVLAHVGMLGLSLPYVLELMEPAGDRAATSFTPVELIVVDEAAQATVSAAKRPTVDKALSEPTERSETSVAEEATATITEASRPASRSVDSRPAAISSSQDTASPSSVTPAVSDSVPSQVPEADDPVRGDSGGSAAGQTPEATQPDSPLPARETGQERTGQERAEAESPVRPPVGETPSAEESQPEDSQSEDSQPEASEAEDSTAASGSSSATTVEPGGGASASGEAEGAAGDLDNGVSEPPVVEGEQLPAPGAMLGEEAPQVAALQVMKMEINTVQDQKDVPPRLLDASGTITLQPDSLGCGQVDFTQGPLTYRLAINADSSLRTVTPVPLDTRSSVEAVACLIKSAGFRFEAAMSEGVAVLDDSLMMTVQVIESQLE